jgi:hypothetical protein
MEANDTFFALNLAAARFIISLLVSAPNISTLSKPVSRAACANATSNSPSPHAGSSTRNFPLLLKPVSKQASSIRRDKAWAKPGGVKWTPNSFLIFCDVVNNKSLHF